MGFVTKPASKSHQKRKDKTTRNGYCRAISMTRRIPRHLGKPALQRVSTSAPEFFVPIERSKKMKTVRPEAQKGSLSGPSQKTLFIQQIEIFLTLPSRPGTF